VLNTGENTTTLFSEVSRACVMGSSLKIVSIVSEGDSSTSDGDGEYDDRACVMGSSLKTVSVVSEGNSSTSDGYGEYDDS
jgi:hypothetical protein